MQFSQKTQCQYGVNCLATARETGLLWSPLTGEEGLQAFQEYVGEDLAWY